MSECCFIDQRWNVKVADFEHHKLEMMNRVKRTSQVSQVSPLDEESSFTDDPNMQVKYICSFTNDSDMQVRYIS